MRLRFTKYSLGLLNRKEFGNTASRSVSYLAAPAFAAAMMGREVLGTLSVYRHVLLIAEITVTENSDLVGLALRDVDRAGLTQIGRASCRERV